MFCEVEDKSVGLMCALKSLSSFWQLGHPAQPLNQVTFHKKLNYLTYGKQIGLKNVQIDRRLLKVEVIVPGPRVFDFHFRVGS